MGPSSWQPFASDADAAIPSGPEPGAVVALLAPRPDTDASWAAGLALDLAARWAESGHKIVVADAALEHPTMHEEVGLPNEEGVTDAARFGASVARIARPVPGRSFFLVTAGSPAADAAGVAGSARWRRLVAGFGEAGVTLVLFLREGGAGVATFLASAADVVVLAAAGEVPPAVPDEARARVRAVLGPEGTAVPAASAADAAPFHASETTDDGPDPDDGEMGLEGAEPARDPLDDLLGAGDGPDGSVVAASSDASGDAAPFGGELQPGPPVVDAGARKRGGSDPDARRKLIWVVVVVLALVAFILIGALGTG